MNVDSIPVTSHEIEVTNKSSIPSLEKRTGLPGHEKDSLTAFGKVIADHSAEIIAHPNFISYSQEMGGSIQEVWMKLLQTLRTTTSLSSLDNLLLSASSQAEAGFLLLCQDLLKASMPNWTADLQSCLPPDLAREIFTEVNTIDMLGVDPRHRVSAEQTESAINDYLLGDELEAGQSPKHPNESLQFLSEFNTHIPERQVDLQNVVVIIGVGLGRTNKSAEVMRTRQSLINDGIASTAVNWPPFKEPYNTFESQAEWFAEEWWKEHEEELKGKKIIYYGHSFGDLVGRWIMKNYPDKVSAVIGACGPARTSESVDGYPTQLRLADSLPKKKDEKSAMQVITWALQKLGGWKDVSLRTILEWTQSDSPKYQQLEKIMQALGNHIELKTLQTKSQAEVDNSMMIFFLKNATMACSVYLSHLLDEDRWRDCAKSAIPRVPFVSWYGNKDLSLDLIGHRASKEQEKTIHIRHPSLGHNMIPAVYLKRLLAYVVSESDERDRAYNPARLELQAK